jgi:hypothetical protein
VYLQCGEELEKPRTLTRTTSHQSMVNSLKTTWKFWSQGAQPQSIAVTPQLSSSCCTDTMHKHLNEKHTYKEQIHWTLPDSNLTSAPKLAMGPWPLRAYFISYYKSPETPQCNHSLESVKGAPGLVLRKSWWQMTMFMTPLSTRSCTGDSSSRGIWPFSKA